MYISYLISEMQGCLQTSLVTEDVITNLSSVFKRLEEKTTCWNVFDGQFFMVKKTDLFWTLFFWKMIFQ